MYKNATKEIYLKGTVILTANELPTIRDLSEAIMRRMRPFKCSKRPPMLLKLLCQKNGLLTGGPLGLELPGILAQVLAVDKADVEKYIRDFAQVEALQAGIEEAANILNPLRLFVQEALEVGVGTFLGFRPHGGKETRDFASQRLLYPIYLDYCFKRGLSKPLGHNDFSKRLLSACDELGIKAEKVRKYGGMYIKGVIVRPNYYS
jgi:phage/plasmid-associated DNA primase